MKTIKGWLRWYKRWSTSIVLFLGIFYITRAVFEQKSYMWVTGGFMFFTFWFHTNNHPWMDRKGNELAEWYLERKDRRASDR